MLTSKDVPVGGCVKYTIGTYQQVFDKEGNLISECFVADDIITVIDHNGNVLKHNNPLTKFNAPFGTDDCDNR